MSEARKQETTGEVADPLPLPVLETSLRLNDQLCFPLYATSRQMTRLYAVFLDPLGLTYPQYLVLLVLWEQAPRTVTEIGAELQLNTNTITPLLKRLEQQGFILRVRSKTDERVVEINLTPEGLALYKECQAIPDCMVTAIHWDWDKTAQLKELLDSLNLALIDAVERQESSES